MSAFATTGTASLFLPIKLALRELRGGLRGFVVFIACIAVGVMTIAAVGSFSRSLTEGLAREGRTILGGDLAFSLIQREAAADERAFLASKGTLSVNATLRAMARTTAGGTALVELKSADSAYPLYGALTLDPARSLGDALAQRDGVFGVVAEPSLLTRLGLSAGDRITVGNITLEIRAQIRNEPDKLSDGIAFGPRLIISEEALRATELLQPGSLVRWNYRLKLPPHATSDGDSDALVSQAQGMFPQAGWEVRTRANASPQLERNIERFMQFLTIVGLTALLVGGVGVANATKGYIERKYDDIATMKALGAPGASVVAIYLVQVLVLAGIGIAIGIAAGAALPYIVSALFGSVIPLPVAPALYPDTWTLAAAYGVLTSLAFALWPLGRAHDVPVSALFRDAITTDARWPRMRYVVATVIVVAILATFAVVSAYDRRIALIFVVAAGGVLLALRAIASMLMAAASRLPRARSTAVRLAVANIHRPGALTPTVVLSLGLGLALLVTVTLIDGNLRQQFAAALPERAPAFYFIDIQQQDSDRFAEAIGKLAPGAKLERVPMLRGRIVAARGIRADQIAATPQAAWALQGDRGITYAATMPEGSRVVAGQWWAPDHAGPPLISLEKRIADGIGVKVGDTLTVNILGRNITARIANLRVLDWQSLGINFVLVFSPNAFRGAPHTTIATLTYPAGASDANAEIAVVKAIGTQFPGITVVRIKEALETVSVLVTNLMTAVRSASLITILSAIMVLGGALSASHRQRVYEAVVLKTLGATRARLLAAYGLEYLLLGLATAAFGVAAGSLAAWFVVSDIMNLRFVWLPAPAIAAALGALALTVGLGLAGTMRALGQKAAPVLRHL